MGYFDGPKTAQKMPQKYAALDAARRSISETPPLSHRYTTSIVVASGVKQDFPNPENENLPDQLFICAAVQV